MKELEQLKVVRFTLNRVPNPYPGGDLPWQVYHSVRNAIVRTCRRHGPIGPLGERVIKEGEDFPDINDWEAGDKQLGYYIIDDQYNHERYLHMELYGDDPFNPAWLASVVGKLKEYPGWGIGINQIPDGYILIFGNKLMVHGKPFQKCRDAASVIKVARRQIKRRHKKWWQFWQ